MLEKNSAEKQEKVNSRVWYLLLLPLILISLLIYAYFYFTNEEPSQERLKTEQKEKEKMIPRDDSFNESVLGGKIFLSLTETDISGSNIYTLDLMNMELRRYFEDSEYNEFMSHLSPDREMMAFVRAYPEEEVSQLLGYYPMASDYDMLELTERIPTFIRNPRFSEDNSFLAFWYNPESIETGALPEDHIISVISRDDEERFVLDEVTSGAFPVFEKNSDYMLFLKNDGLYVYDIENYEERLVYPTKVLEVDFETEEGELPFWTNVRIAYCPNYDRIFLTSTYSSELQIIDVLSWENFDYEDKSSYELVFGIAGDDNISTVNWPVVSPDGNFLALQVFALDEDEDQYLSHLRILNVSTLLDSASEGEDFDLGDFVELSFPLLKDGSPYNESAIWITDWIN